MIKYLLEKKFKIEIISASFLEKSDKDIFSKFNLKIKKIKPIKINLLISMISLLIYKISYQRKVNKINVEKKSNFDPKIKYNKMLRSKNEQYDEIYKNRLLKSFNNTIICISPHLGSVSTPRELKYPEYLRANKRNYFYYNPKFKFSYIIKQAMRIYLTPLPHDFKIHFLQIIILINIIDDFIKYVKNLFPNIQEFYTGYEFHQSLVYLTEKLRGKEIKVIFFEHGIGIGHNPIANYDLLYVFSKLQQNYYYGTSKFKYIKFNFPLKKKENDLSKKKFALLFICTVFSKSQTYNFNSTYQEVINYVERIAREYEFPVYAKYHPFSTERDKILSKRIIVINKIEDLPQEYYYLSITLISTYIIELLHSMPFLLINPQKKTDLNFFLPTTDFVCVNTYQEFREKIEKFMSNYSYYNEYWQSLISLLKENYFFE